VSGGASFLRAFGRKALACTYTFHSDDLFVFLVCDDGVDLEDGKVRGALATAVLESRFPLLALGHLVQLGDGAPRVGPALGRNLQVGQGHATRAHVRLWRVGATRGRAGAYR
jgi:hypothetical protein